MYYNSTEVDRTKREKVNIIFPLKRSFIHEIFHSGMHFYTNGGLYEVMYGNKDIDQGVQELFPVVLTTNTLTSAAPVLNNALISPNIAVLTLSVSLSVE